MKIANLVRIDGSEIEIDGEQFEYALDDKPITIAYENGLCIVTLEVLAVNVELQGSA